VQLTQSPAVTADAEVAIVAIENLTQAFALQFKRPMPHEPALLIESLERTRKAIFRRELLHYRVSRPENASPSMSERKRIQPLAPRGQLFRIRPMGFSSGRLDTEMDTVLASRAGREDYTSTPANRAQAGRPARRGRDHRVMADARYRFIARPLRATGHQAIQRSQG
jgi:hypothetical protein